MAEAEGIDRRTFLAGVGVAGAAAAVAPVVAPDAARADSPDTGNVRLRQGTDFAAQVSPDGRTLALDLVGVLWLAPVTGGTARRLTTDLYDIAQPEWSPDGRTLAFQSYRDGVFNLWLAGRDGGDLRQLTRGPYDHREPRWSPDVRTLAFSSDLSGSYGVYTCDPR